MDCQITSDTVSSMIAAKVGDVGVLLSGGRISCGDQAMVARYRVATGIEAEVDSGNGSRGGYLSNMLVMAVLVSWDNSVLMCRDEVVVFCMSEAKKVYGARLSLTAIRPRVDIEDLCLYIRHAPEGSSGSIILVGNEVTGQSTVLIRLDLNDVVWSGVDTPYDRSGPLVLNDAAILALQEQSISNIKSRRLDRQFPIPTLEVSGGRGIAVVRHTGGKGQSLVLDLELDEDDECADEAD
jgi:hypothetical protein